MQAFQQIGGVAVVVESTELPTLFAVAGFAGAAVPSFVDVVLAMAGSAGSWCFHGSYGDGMTGLAFH